MKNLKMSLTKVRKYLKKVVFNPRKPGKIRIIAEMEDSNYYERQAQLLIEDARATRLGGGEPEGYEDYIIKAIQLLIMAGIVENG